MIEGGVWRHHKGGIYRVIARARHAETGDPLVVYQDIGTGRVYARPESQWEQVVEINHLRGHVFRRFERMPA